MSSRLKALGFAFRAYRWHRRSGGVSLGRFISVEDFRAWKQRRGITEADEQAFKAKRDTRQDSP